jgi:hypothetical protein
MDIQSQVLDSVLRKYGKSDKELYTSLENVSEDEFKKELEKLNLSDFTQRNSFYWELQTVVEKCVYEHSGLEDSERMAEIIAETWNQAKEPKISSSVAISFLYKLNLKYPNSRKAFVSVCDGDLQSYKTFNSKSMLFLDLLIRFLTCNTGKQQMFTVLRTVEEVMPRLFDDYSRSDSMDAINRLGFQQRKGRVNYLKMNAYKRSIGIENLVFAEGMKSILLEVLNDVEESETLTVLKHKLTSVIEKELHDELEEDFKVDDLLEEHIAEVNAPTSLEPKKVEASSPNAEIVAPIEEQESVDETAVREEVTDAPFFNEQVVMGGVGEPSVQAVQEEQKVQKEDEPKKEIISSLEHALAAVQSALDKVSQLTQVQSVAVQEESQLAAKEQQLAIAEEEINRLKLALKQEKEKVAQAEEKAYTKILQAIGGENSNYLLSDLFEESQGKVPSNPNISAGRLINLFSSLSLAIGLEEHSNGYELGDTFSVHKDELIKNYRIDGPVVSQEDVIQVKLLKYGWTINGKVVVQPLVTEVKEEV